MSKAKLEKQLVNLISSVEFAPTPSQRECKSAFWIALEENPVVDPTAITPRGVYTLTGDSRVFTWWKQESFAAWFMNKEEFKVRLESAAHMALSVLADVMLDPDAAASARVAAAKLVIEASGKSKKAEETAVSDKMIQSMTQEQLEAYIAKRLPKEVK